MTNELRGKILVADDDVRNRKLLDTLLHADGYTVRCVESGPATLQAIATEIPDVLLLDLMMPGMDGFEVLRRLRAEPATRGIPIVMITALDDDASGARLAAAGIADILTKPLDRWKLKACLEKLIGRDKS